MNFVTGTCSMRNNANDHHIYNVVNHASKCQCEAALVGLSYFCIMDMICSEDYNIAHITVGFFVTKLNCIGFFFIAS